MLCTDAGAFVVERARKLVFDSRCLERDVSMFRERLIGDIAIGVGPYPAATMVPALLTDMRQRYPTVNARVEVNNAAYLAEHLRAEELDFYVADLRNIPESSDLAVIRIGQLSASFYVRNGHPLLATPTVVGKDLLPYGLASVRIPDKILFALAPLMGLPQGMRLPLAIECDDLNLLKSVAIATDTVVACVDAGAVEEVASGQLVLLKTSDIPTQFSDMGVVSLKGRSFSPMARYAVDFLAMLGLQQARP